MQDPHPLPYLAEKVSKNYDIALEVSLPASFFHFVGPVDSSFTICSDENNEVTILLGLVLSLNP